jgi:hypothetical protein
MKHVRIRTDCARTLELVRVWCTLLEIFRQIKVEVQFTLEQATKAQSYPGQQYLDKGPELSRPTIFRQSLNKMHGTNNNVKLCIRVQCHVLRPSDPLKADSHIACRAHAVPLPCRAAKGLECVFPI